MSPSASWCLSSSEENSASASPRCSSRRTSASSNGRTFDRPPLDRPSSAIDPRVIEAAEMPPPASSSSPAPKDSYSTLELFPPALATDAGGDGFGAPMGAPPPRRSTPMTPAPTRRIDRGGGGRREVCTRSAPRSTEARGSRCAGVWRDHLEEEWERDKRGTVCPAWCPPFRT